MVDGALLEVVVNFADGEQLDELDRDASVHDVEVLEFEQVLGRQELDDAPEVDEVAQVVVDVCDGELVLELGHLLVQGADDVVHDVVLLLGLEVLGVVAEYHVALHIAGGLGEDLQLLDRLQRRVQPHLRHLSVLVVVLADLGEQVRRQLLLLPLHCY